MSVWYTKRCNLQGKGALRCRVVLLGVEVLKGSVIGVIRLQILANAGLGRVDEARQLLSDSCSTLEAEFGAAYEAVGEARYYLMLAELRAAPVSDIPELSSTLAQVIRLSSNPIITGARPALPVGGA